MDNTTREELSCLWLSAGMTANGSINSAIKDVVLVDLMHGDLEFLSRTLVVAKAIQFSTGCQLIGILGSPGVVTRSTFVEPNVNRRLAEAFGLTDIIDVPTDLPVPEAHASILTRLEALAASTTEGAALSVESRLALAMIRTEDGFAIGRVVAETFMRSELQPIVLGGEGLLRHARQVLGFDGWIRSLISDRNPRAFVTGHIEYCPWGHLAELIVRAGGRAVYFRCDAHVPIILIDEIEADETLGGGLRRIEAEAFGAFEAQLVGHPHAARWNTLALARTAGVRNGFARNYRWTSKTELEPWIPPFTNNLCTYVAFAHTFTDQPLSDVSLFADHADWLETTLAHAVRTQAYNLVVKVHPLDGFYDLTGQADRLAALFSHASNVLFTRDQINLQAFAATCTAGITVRGTPGIEMTSLGMPMILAGRGPYSDIGFCLTPPSREAYFRLLENGPPFSIDREAQAARASLFHVFDRFWSAPSSPLAPAFRGRQWEDVERGLVEATRVTSLEVDPLVLALARAWPGRNVKVRALELDASLLLQPTVR